MSGDSFKPEEGGEVEVINPDEGHNEIDTQLEAGDAMDAAELDALKALEDTSEDNEATEVEPDPEPVTEDEQPEVEQAAEEVPAEDEGTEPQAEQWDGNPATLPETLQPAYQAMLKGFHQKTRELADMRRETQELNAKLLLKLDGDPGSPQAEDGPPPMPVGESVTAEQYEEWARQNAKYVADQVLQEHIASGNLVTAEQYQPIQQQARQQEVMMGLQSMEGFSDDAAAKMVEIANENPYWGRVVDNLDGAGIRELASLAIGQVQAKQIQTAQATKQAESIKKKATAASRATPRVSTPAGAAPEDVFAKEGFKNEDERMAYAEKIAIEQYGG